MIRYFLQIRPGVSSIVSTRKFSLVNISSVTLTAKTVTIFSLEIFQVLTLTAKTVTIFSLEIIPVYGICIWMEDAVLQDVLILYDIHVYIHMYTYDVCVYHCLFLCVCIMIF